MVPEIVDLNKKTMSHNHFTAGRLTEDQDANTTISLSEKVHKQNYYFFQRLMACLVQNKIDCHN